MRLSFKATTALIASTRITRRRLMNGLCKGTPWLRKMVRRFQCFVPMAFTGALVGGRADG